MGLWVKICGITRPEDAWVVERAGANALGLIFSKSSPRFVTPDQAKDICDAVSSAVEKVAVLVHPDWKDIRRILDRVPVDTIQWHGGPLDDEGLRRLSEFERPWIYALRWSGEEPLTVPPHASRLLVEGRSDQGIGGTGVPWDYRRLSTVPSPLPLILSGGLSPETVEQVLEMFRKGALAGVDVASGVEKAPGQKDPSRIMDFVQRVREWEKRS